MFPSIKTYAIKLIHDFSLNYAFQIQINSQFNSFAILIVIFGLDWIKMWLTEWFILKNIATAMRMLRETVKDKPLKSAH